MTEINRFTLIVAAILAVLIYVASTTLNTESIATTAIPTNNSLSEINNNNNKEYNKSIRMNNETICIVGRKP